MKTGLDKLTSEIHFLRLLYEFAHYKKAIHYLNKAMQDTQLMNDPMTRVYIYNELGDIYFSMKDMEKSEEYYQKAFEIDLQHLSDHRPAVLVTYSIQAALHKRQGDLEQTLVYYNKLLDVSLKHPEQTECCNADSVIIEILLRSI